MSCDDGPLRTLLRLEAVDDMAEEADPPAAAADAVGPRRPGTYSTSNGLLSDRPEPPPPIGEGNGPPWKKLKPPPIIGLNPVLKSKLMKLMSCGWYISRAPATFVDACGGAMTPPAMPGSMRVEAAMPEPTVGPMGKLRAGRGFDKVMLMVFSCIMGPSTSKLRLL